MKIDWVYISAWRAMYQLYLEEKDEELEDWLSPANPYNALDHRAFAQCYQTEFENYAREHDLQEDYSAADSYKLVSGFAHDCYPEWGYRFEDISLDEWEALCEIITQEEGARVVSYVKPSGHPSWMAATLRSLIGKTLKSIEYVPDGSADEAWLQVRLSTGSDQVRIGLYLFDSFGRKVIDFICSEEDSSISLGDGEPRMHLIGERVTGVEVVRFVASIDGAPLEGKPEDGYDFERMPGQYMAVVVRTKEGVYSFYRRGCEDGTIHMGRSVPTDEELGIEEFRDFWSEGGHEVKVRRDVFEVE